MSDKLMCGECGGDKFTLQYHKDKKDGARFGGAPFSFGHLSVHCVKCGDVSTVKSGPASLEPEGNLCGGWRKEKSG